MKKIKNVLPYILLPLGIGFIGSLLGNSKGFQDEVIQPSFAPPGFIFPIVWTILYILMGISSFLVSKSDCNYKKTGLTLYGMQLAINCIWNLFFFRLKYFLFSFYLLLFLILLVILMIIHFYKCNKTSAYLQIPYILWLIFASILTYNIYLLN